jgi:hypothetical protein
VLFNLLENAVIAVEHALETEERNVGFECMVRFTPHVFRCSERVVDVDAAFTKTKEALVEEAPKLRTAPHEIVCGFASIEIFFHERFIRIVRFSSCCSAVPLARDHRWTSSCVELHSANGGSSWSPAFATRVRCFF